MSVVRPPAAPSGLAAAGCLLAGGFASLMLPRAWPWWVYLPMLISGGVLWVRPSRGRTAGIFLAGFGLAGLHAVWALSLQLPATLEKRDWIVEGVVADLPQPDVRRTRFRLRVDDAPSQPEVLRGRLLQLSWYDDFGAVGHGPRTALRAGARWRMHVRLRAPRGLINPGGFDSERHALVQRIAATGYLRQGESAVELRKAEGLDAWREGMSDRIDMAVPSGTSRFIAALALGDTRGLGDADWEALRATGLTHLIAISGFHVGLVSGFFAFAASGVWRLFPRWARRVPRPQAMALGALIGACGYAAVAGFALPTVRTVLMIAVVVLARLWRRPVRVSGSLALALMAVLLFDPLSLLMAGFWLSFAGVAWLVWCLPARDEPVWRSFLSAQGVATLGLLPLTVVLFGQASLAGPLANLVAIPWWSLVVVPLSLVGTALEALHAGLGGWAWRLAGWCFDLSWPGFLWLAQGRFALWWLPEAPALAVPLALLGAFWLMLPRGVPAKPLALLLWLPLLWPDRDLPAQGGAELVVLDVGQGLSVLVRTRHHALLYDAGPAVRDGFDAGERVVVPALRALGVARLDRLVVSHADQDHAGGAPAVRSALPVGLTQAPQDSPTPADTVCQAGQSWRWDGVTFRYLHPTPHFPYLRNESSCVLRIETAHGAMLLTGDIGEVVERGLVRRERDGLRADVVLAAHHGSGGSSDGAFVAATGAKLALVSSGHGNRFGHPRADIVARWQRHGAEVLDTPRSGALRIWMDEDGLAVRERRHAHRRLWRALR